jgi:hypothetical protein
MSLFESNERFYRRVPGTRTVFPIFRTPSPRPLGEELVHKLHLIPLPCAQFVRSVYRNKVTFISPTRSRTFKEAPQTLEELLGEHANEYLHSWVHWADAQIALHCRGLRRNGDNTEPKQYEVVLLTEGNLAIMEDVAYQQEVDAMSTTAMVDEPYQSQDQANDTKKTAKRAEMKTKQDRRGLKLAKRKLLALAEDLNKPSQPASDSGSSVGSDSDVDSIFSSKSTNSKSDGRKIREASPGATSDVVATAQPTAAEIRAQAEIRTQNQQDMQDRILMWSNKDLEYLGIPKSKCELYKTAIWDNVQHVSPSSSPFFSSFSFSISISISIKSRADNQLHQLVNWTPDRNSQNLGQLCSLLCMLPESDPKCLESYHFFAPLIKAKEGKKPFEISGDEEPSREVVMEQGWEWCGLTEQEEMVVAMRYADDY